MEKKYGKLRNYIFYAGIGLSFLCSFTQLLDLSGVVSFYVALAGVSLLAIGVVLMITILLHERKHQKNI
ncbi:hypothetical protein [Enterococcus sp. AZ072]|uniref:hypothetical protein n=1 Tax=unclassified Enterococcus TaxID=2608891 RepID=UPI003D2B7C2D